MIKVFFCLAGAILFCLTPHPSTAAAKPSAAAVTAEKLSHYEKKGLYAVRSLELEKTFDSKRNDRPVPIKVVFPKDGGSFPLVVISHGAGGSFDSHIYQAEHLASHGYVVLCVEHIDSNNISMKYFMSRAGGGKSFREALHHITKNSVAVLERPKDISFAIDTAIVLNKSNRELAGKINSRKIAVMGHSFGAYTTLAIMGAQPIVDHLEPHQENGRKGLAGDLSDQRVTFGLAMSPQGPGSTFFSKESYKNIKKPLICFSGSKDEQKNSEGNYTPAETRREVFKLLPTGQKYFLWLANADHVSFSDNKHMWVLPSPSRRDVQRITKAIMTISCDHFLKNRAEARQAFSKEFVQSLVGETVTDIEWMEK
jgi:predicted dienelactone hydrolase